MSSTPPAGTTPALDNGDAPRDLDPTIHPLASCGRIEEAIVAYVAKHDYVSFAELQRELEPYYEVRGERAIRPDGHENLYAWAGMSEEFSRDITKILADKTLVLCPSSPLVYAIDGGALNFPLAKKIQPYKTPHWFPVTLRIRTAEKTKKAKKAKGAKGAHTRG